MAMGGLACVKEAIKGFAKFVMSLIEAAKMENGGDSLTRQVGK